MNKLLIIALIATFCIFNITESSKRVVRQYGYPQNFYPTGNLFGSRSSVTSNQGNNFGPNPAFNPAFPNFPNWNQPLPLGGFRPANIPTANEIASRFGDDSNTVVKKTSSSCSYSYDGKKYVENCQTIQN